MYIRNLKSDTDVIYALDHQAPKGKYSGLWTPRHHLLSSLSKDLEPWSKGDLVVSSMLIATNLMWFVIPVILQFQLVPTTRRFTVRYFFAQFSTSAGYASFGLITYHCFFYLIAYSVEKTASAQNTAVDEQDRISKTASVDIPGRKGVPAPEHIRPGDWINLLIPSISLSTGILTRSDLYHSTSPKRITLFIKNQAYDLEAHKPVGGGTGIRALIPYLMHYSQATTGSITLVWVAQSADICIQMLSRIYTHITFFENLNFKTHIHLTSEIHSEMQATMSSQNELTKTQNQQSQMSSLSEEASSDSTSSTLTQESSAHTPSYGTLNAKIESHQIPLGMVAAYTAIVMFSSGIFWICSVVSGAPNILSYFCSYGQLITIAIVNSLRLGSSRRYSIDKSGVVLSLLQADDVRPYPIETFIEAFNPSRAARPQIKFSGNTFINDEESATDISKVAVMAAGPDKIVYSVNIKAWQFIFWVGYTLDLE
ncbi:hypothetical protein BSLG_002955 [Batrachochytrium salamandrivorans]|nr:hypothetical protein BSLG_002955 [Batrachochytrium salamandrivorans]